MSASESSLESPLVTIYLPTKNRLDFLKRAVRSVFSQTYTNIELIVVNDGSTDNTQQWLDELSLKEPRLLVITEQKSIGACAARNKAINNANGQFITGLDDDDEFLPDRIKIFLENYDPKYSFLSHGVLWFYGRKGKVIDATNRELSLNDMLSYNYATNQVFTESHKLKAIQGFDTTFKACQDYDTWVRLVLVFGTAKKIHGYSYIQHQGHEEDRISTIENKLNGYSQFYNKHNQLMSKNNKINQSFMCISASKKRYHFCLYLKHLRGGFFIKKTRYLLSSNFPLLAGLRSKALK
ncbi:glycosyltransferase [Pseudoalteromonas sp. S1608]|uniref:glycosyltransferase n=1 Tax=Pseudoalteromonas sp. S1608 TaxID=579504 RepID=UPI00110BF115|nr:glycosyltransferase [Pseudoalteromonas sp. S1608]TMP74030.1 glycosyl transferase [Pseudoalteromonas sp. S1608]